MTTRYDVSNMSGSNMTIEATGVLVSDVTPQSAGSLLWLPYTVVTVVMVMMLFVSFVRFHLQNKERYQKRVVVANRKQSIHTSGVQYDPECTRSATAKVNYHPRPPDVTVDDVKACSSSASNAVIIKNLCTCEDDDEVTANARLSNGESRTRHPDIGDPKPSVTCQARGSRDKSLLERMEEEIIMAALANQKRVRINCRQSLTFIKRESRGGVPGDVHGGATVDRDQSRWISLKNAERRVGHNVGKGNQVSPSVGGERCEQAPSILSFVGSRLKQNSNRRVKINMWTGNKRRPDPAVAALSRDNNRRF